MTSLLVRVPPIPIHDRRYLKEESKLEEIIIEEGDDEGEEHADDDGHDITINQDLLREKYPTFTDARIGRRYYRRGTIRNLAHTKPDAFITSVDKFVSMEDEGTDHYQSKQVMAKYANPLNHVWRLPFLHDRLAFLRWVDIIMSMILTFVVTLFPWAVLAALVHHAVYVHHMEGKFRTMESMHKTLGIIVAFTIGFKNKTAYDRFWEGRKYVSIMYQFARAIVMDTYAALPKKTEGEDKRRKLMDALSRDIRRRTNLLVALIRQGVRESKIGYMPGSQVSHVPFDRDTFMLDPVVPRLRDMLTPEEYRRYQAFSSSIRPSIVAGELISLVNIMGDNVMDPPSYRRYCLAAIKGMMDNYEAMLRIKDTPVARPYNWVMMITLCVVVIFSPPLIYQGTGLQKDQNGLSVLLITELLVLSFYGIAQIGNELEDPYGYELPDVPLEQVGLQLHNETLQIATGLGDDTYSYIPDDAWENAPRKCGYLEYGWIFFCRWMDWHVTEVTKMGKRARNKALGRDGPNEEDEEAPPCEFFTRHTKNPSMRSMTVTKGAGGNISSFKPSTIPEDLPRGHDW